MRLSQQKPSMPFNMVLLAHGIRKRPGEGVSPRQLDEPGLAKVEVVVAVAADVNLKTVEEVRHVVAAEDGRLEGGGVGVAAEDAEVRFVRGWGGGGGRGEDVVWIGEDRCEAGYLVWVGYVVL